MQIRLITMIIHRLQSGERIHFFPTSKNIFLWKQKDTIQTIIKRFLPYQIYQFVYLVRNIKCILHGISFLKSLPRSQWIKIFQKISFSILGTNQTGLRIIKILPAIRQIRE